jgi:hypothetical protein
MHEEPLPKASAELPVPTVPLFATLMFVLPVAFTKRTVAVGFVDVIVSLSSHAAKKASDSSAQNVSLRFRMNYLRRRQAATATTFVICGTKAMRRFDSDVGGKSRSARKARLARQL